MSWSFRLLRFKGIDVRVHVTFFLILLWAAWSWNGRSPVAWQGAAFGVVAILLLFVSVTLHEFAHSLLAIRYGVRVRDITLLPIGGVSQIETIPEQPGQELRMTVAGPLVNFAIAGALILVGALLQIGTVLSLQRLVSSMGEVSWAGLLAYLITTNLVLGVFNLIPAFPMDGGRILRAILAMNIDNWRATAIAARVGQGLAWVLGLVGFTSGNYSLILIAFFVWLGASQEEASARVENVFGAMTVSQATTRQPQTLSRGDPLRKAIDLTMATFQADFPVVEAGRVVGLLTQGDVFKALHTQGSDVPVGQAMRSGPPATTPDEPLLKAQQRMAVARTPTMVVLGPNQELIGLLTASDINQAYGLLAAGPQATAAVAAEL